MTYTFKDFFEKTKPVKSKGLGKILTNFDGQNIYEQRVKLIKAELEPKVYAVIISADGYCLKDNKIVENKPSFFEIKYLGFFENEAIKEFNAVVEKDEVLKN